MQWSLFLNYCNAKHATYILICALQKATIGLHVAQDGKPSESEGRLHAAALVQTIATWASCLLAGTPLPEKLRCPMRIHRMDLEMW